MPYKLFTLKHDPEKTNPEYYRILLDQYNLAAEDVIYFEHNNEAVESAKSVGINTYFYDHTKENMVALKTFLDANL